MSKRILLIFLLCVCGVAYVTVATFAIADITPEFVNGQYTEIKIADGTVLQHDDLPVEIFSMYFAMYTTEMSEFKYIQLDISDLQTENDKVHIYYSKDGINFSEEMKFYTTVRNGRNIIKLPRGNYVRTDLNFSDGTVFKLNSAKASDKLPLRYRHIGLIGIISASWCAAIITLLCKERNLFAQVKNFKRYLYLLFNLVRKDFITKYRRSALGVLWSVLNPLLMAAIISAVFVNIFRSDIQDFPVYYLTGALIFNFVSESTLGSLLSILNAGALFKKVYIPKYLFPLEKCVFGLVNCLFSFAALLVLMPFLGVIPKPTTLLFFVPLLCAFVFSLGLGMLLASANVFFRDIGHLYSVWLTAWSFFTPMFYPVSILPAGLRYGITHFNPLYVFIDYLRDIVSYGVIPSAATTFMCISYAIGFMFIGLLVFKKTQKSFILYV